MSSRKAIFGMVLVLFVSGLFGQNEPDKKTALQEATSLLKQPLFQPVLSEPIHAEFTEKLKIAERRVTENPDSVDAWIWFGRRTAYLGRYQDAIDIYTQALERAPKEPRLYRHRGHRYLSVRKINLAIGDLEKAATLVEGMPDQVEPDGLPNAQNIPTSTLKTNIFYHLGLAYYVSGRFEEAVVRYRKCLEYSKNDDMWCATAYWLYLSLQRAGDSKAAADLLATMKPDMQLIENEGYYQLLLAFGDTNRLELLIKDEQEDAVQSATRAYGIAMATALRGNQSQSQKMLHQILEGKAWAAFGYLAAEADLARGR